MPANVLACLRRLAEAGLPVIFTESLPQRSAEGWGEFDFASVFRVVPTEDLAADLRARGLCHISGTGRGLRYLRFYHVRRDGRDIYAFLNEDIHGAVDGCLTLPQAGECLVYEPWANRCYRSCAPEGKLPLHLEKGNLLIFVFGGEVDGALPVLPAPKEATPLQLRFDLWIKDEGETEFRLLAEDSPLFDVTAPDRLPEFSGELLYKTTFAAPEGAGVLDLGFVGETAEVKLNGEDLGVRINAPYKFDLTKALQPGQNRLEILVRSNPGHRRHDDGLSCFSHIPPTGILGPISLCCYEA